MRLTFAEKNGLAMVTDFDRNRRWVRTTLLNADNPSQTPRVIFDLSSQDRYRNPGTPMMKTLPSGHRAVRMDGDFIFLNGQGASPQGDRPFLDRFNLQTLKAERIFRLKRTLKASKHC